MRNPRLTVMTHPLKSDLSLGLPLVTLTDYGIEDGGRLVVEEELRFKPGIYGGMQLRIEMAVYDGTLLLGPVDTEVHRLNPVWLAVQQNITQQQMGYSVGFLKPETHVILYRGDEIESEETRFCDLPDIDCFTRIELRARA